MRDRLVIARVLVTLVFGSALACGAAPAPRPVIAKPASLETLARRSLETELRRLGWSVQPGAQLVASRGDLHYAIGIVVETSEGPKLTVRLSLFDATSHSLQGEVSSWAVATGETPAEAGPRLAPMLGKHAAEKLDRLANR